MDEKKEKVLEPELKLKYTFVKEFKTTLKTYKIGEMYNHKSKEVIEYLLTNKIIK